MKKTTPLWQCEQVATCAHVKDGFYCPRAKPHRFSANCKRTSSCGWYGKKMVRVCCYQMSNGVRTKVLRHPKKLKGDSLVALEAQVHRSLAGILKPRRQFEYKWMEIIGSCINTPDTIHELNKLGKDGWQVIGSLSETSTWHSRGIGFSGLFMREKQQP